MGMAEQLLMSAAAEWRAKASCCFATTYAVRLAPRLRLHLPRHRRGEPERQDRLRAARADHRLRTQPPGDRRSCDLPRHAEPDGVDPCDALDIEQAVPAIAAHDGPVYMRLLRGNVPLVLDQYDYRFELGKAKLLRDGKDALIISSGFMTMRALEAANTLHAEGVDVAILHSPTVKPLDEETILKEASRNGRLVIVAENHSIIGGLGEAVAGLLLRSGWLRRSGKSPCRMRFSTPAPCRRCTTVTASRPTPWSRSISGWM